MTTPFASFAPGFEFLQSLVKNSGGALPGIGQWVAPTLDPEELDKRIRDLRTVQFWLEQNARMLGATIQALEVQKMTLSTLQTMNVQMGDLQAALTGKPTADAAVEASAVAAETETAAAPPAAPAVDPMQWWSALTQQFGELASNALKDGASGLPSAHTATPSTAVQPTTRRTKVASAAPTSATTTSAPPTSARQAAASSRPARNRATSRSRP